MSEKTYIQSNVKEIETKFWKIYNAKVRFSDIEKLPKDKWWNVYITIMKRKNLWKFGETHYIIWNDYWYKKNIEKQKEKG